MQLHNFPVPDAFYRVSQKVIVRRGDTILLVHEKDNWSVPGGGLDHGEDPVEGIQRELTEELAFSGAYSVDPRPLLVTAGEEPIDINNPKKNARFITHQMYFVCFNVEFEGGVVAGPDVKEIRFFTMNELHNPDTNIGDLERETAIKALSL